MSKEAMKLALEALKQIDEAMPFPVAKLAQSALREALASQGEALASEAKEQPAPVAKPHEQEPAGWRPATFHRDNLTFNPGLPDEQTVKFWKLQGVEIEYCYTTPQPAQQEPFGYFRYDLRLDAWVQNREGRPGTAFYTSPPQRPWVGLTDEEKADLFEGTAPYYNETDYADAIEAKLKEKNT